MPLPLAPLARTLTLSAGLLTLGLADAGAQLAAGHDKYFGSIIKGRPGKSKPVPESLHRLFNKVTPENSGKWDQVEYTRDSFDFAILDEHYRWAQDRGLPFTLHTLLWSESEPDWVAELSPQEAREEAEEWFAALAARYPDVHSIDVVNEAPHGKMGSAGMKQGFGGGGATGYDDVVEAFRLAREYFPDAILVQNDYGVLEFADGEGKTDEYDALARALRAAGVVDALGCQAHFLERRDGAFVGRRLDTLHARHGLPILITELELAIADDSAQAAKWRDIFPVIWEHPAVAGVTLWGHDEGSMWRDEGYLLRADGSDREALTWLRGYLRGPDRPAGRLEAEEYDAMYGLLPFEGDTVMAGATRGDFLAFRHVDLDGAAAFALRYSDETGFAEVGVHLDSLTAEPIVVAVPPATAAFDVYATFEVALPAALSGVHDVYLSFDRANGRAQYDYFAFRQNATPPADTTGTSSSLDQVAFSRELQVWPNPARDRLDVTWTGGAATLRLLDGLGRQVLTERVADAGRGATLPVDGLTPGRYVLQVVSDRGAGSRVVVVR